MTGYLNSVTQYIASFLERHMHDKPQSIINVMAKVGDAMLIYEGYMAFR